MTGGLFSWSAAGIDTAEQQWLIANFFTELNDSIEWAANAAGVGLIDLSSSEYHQAADGTDRRICAASEPWNFHGLKAGWVGTAGVSKSSFHPTWQGHRRIDELVWSNYGTVIGEGMPTAAGGSGSIPLPNADLRLGPDPVPLQGGSVDALYGPGDQVHLRVVRANPGSALRVVTRSVPAVLGEVTVDGGGIAEFSFEVPAWLAPGFHLITMEDDSGEPVATAQFEVAPGPGCDSGDDVDADGLADSCDSVHDDGPAADLDSDGTANYGTTASVSATPIRPTVTRMVSAVCVIPTKAATLQADTAWPTICRFRHRRGNRRWCRETRHSKSPGRPPPLTVATRSRATQ